MRDLHLAGLAVTTWLAGLLALMCDSFQPAPLLIATTHGLFIAVTCSALCLALVPRALAASSSGESEFYLYTRSVSRCIYIAVYGLALVRLGLYLCFPRHAHSLDDFQFYIAGSVIPLWVIRGVVVRTVRTISVFVSTTTYGLTYGNAVPAYRWDSTPGRRRDR